MTRDAFRAVMLRLSVAHHRELTRPMMLTYWDEFAGADDQAFAEAAAYWTRTQRFFPTIADLRALLEPAPTGTLADAGATFEALLDTAPAYDPRHGDYWTLEAVHDRFGAQGLAAFMAAGGTRAFRDRTDRDVPFLRRDFLKGWEEYNRLPPHQRPVLPGTTRTGALTPLRDALPQLLPPGAGDAWEPPPEDV